MSISMPEIDLKGNSLSSLKQRYPLTQPNSKDVLHKLTKEIILFINGSFKHKDIQRIASRINNSLGVLLVDGGANAYIALLKQSIQEGILLQVQPISLLGDFDSIEMTTKIILQNAFPEMDLVRFDRDKDYTDFEATLQMIKKHKVSKIVIFGGFGGRVDQTLGNVLTIFRKAYLGKVVLIGEENEEVFSLAAGKMFTLSQSKGCFLTLLPFSGHFEFNYHEATLEDLGNGNYRCLKDTVELSLASGQALCVLQRRALLPLHEDTNIPFYRFDESQYLVSDFRILLSSITFPTPFSIQTACEKIFVIKSGQTCTFSVEVAQTISLIPLGGPVQGVKTSGLYWDLRDSCLSPDFLSISNIAMQNDVSIAVQEGDLLCIVNCLVDKQMLKHISSKR